MTNRDPKESLKDIIECWRNAPHPSYKVSNYFQIYADLFSHLRGTDCTFIETGIFDGGSLFMWRSWLGDKARIIGVDLNPAALQWKDHGFEIFIGDQGDPDFWRKTFAEIGPFDAFLDDGGHQSFQQIVTAYEAIGAARGPCVIAVEDTITNFMREFANQGDRSFLNYAKAATDNLTARHVNLFPGTCPPISNTAIFERFQSVYSIQFFTGMVAFKLDPSAAQTPRLALNRPFKGASDFRYHGLDSAAVEWPDPFHQESVVVRGGRA